MMEIIFTLIATHITILCVTLYLHRSLSHGSVIFHPVVNHFMRFWLWLTTGMVTKEWVAVHRKHHQAVDGAKDPHSPVTHGILKILFGGSFLYTKATKDKEMIEKYGRGTPNDWIENNWYSQNTLLGLMVMLAIDVVLFGWLGIIVWLIQMIWIPFLAAGVINGLGHYLGYRNYNTQDHSTNIIPWGILIGGEELHNNHHKSPRSAKLSNRWWEFDIGWFWIKILESVGLAKIKT